MNWLKKIFIILPAMMLGFTLLAGTVRAQQITATLTGTITDQAGSIVPGATVTVTSLETGLTKTATTNEDGQYTIAFLPPGSYNITVAKTDFAAITRENIKLEVAQTANIDVTLGVAGAQVEVEVSSNETPLLQTETSNLETTIEQKLVVDVLAGVRRGRADDVARLHERGVVHADHLRDHLSEHFALLDARLSARA